MPSRFAVLAGVVLLAAACAGGDVSQPTPSGPATTGCSLSLSDVQHTSGITPLRRVDLAPLPSMQLRCSTVFANTSGGLVLAVSEADGGSARLAQVRQGRAAPGVTIQTLTGVGDEAFAADGRFLAFRAGDRVFMLETGPEVLTLKQLKELGQIEAHT